MKTETKVGEAWAIIRHATVTRRRFSLSDPVFEVFLLFMLNRYAIKVILHTGCNDSTRWPHMTDPANAILSLEDYQNVVEAFKDPKLGLNVQEGAGPYADPFI